MPSMNLSYFPSPPTTLTSLNSFKCLHCCSTMKHTKTKMTQQHCTDNLQWIITSNHSLFPMYFFQSLLLLLPYRMMMHRILPSFRSWHFSKSYRPLHWARCVLSTVFFGSLCLAAITTELRIISLEKIDVVKIYCFERRHENGAAMV